MGDYVVEIEGLTKRFFREKQNAVSDLSLKIERGCFYTLLGGNGAGKTTTLKLLVGIHRPTSGSSRLFGCQSERLGADMFRRIGYISETQKIHLNKTVQGLIDYVKPQYPSWDDSFSARMIEQFELPLDRKLKTFSRGMLLKAKQFLALAYNPELLIMDEPFSGLDPLVRQESIENLLEWAQSGNRTVVISSHDIDDIETISERVGIIDSGRLVLDEGMESLKERVQKVQFVTERANEFGEECPDSWIQRSRSGRVVEFTDTMHSPEKTTEAILREFPDASQIEYTPMGLKEIYVSLARSRKKRAAER